MKPASTHSAWRREAALMAAWVAPVVGIAVPFGKPLYGLCAGLALYLCQHLVYTYLLHRWLLTTTSKPPSGSGIWRDIFNALQQLSHSNHQRKHRLQNMEAELRASTAALPDGAVVINAQALIVWCNQPAAELLGLRAQEDRGQRIDNLLRHPQFIRYLAASDHDQQDVEIPSPVDEDKVIAVRIIPYSNQQRLLIARDVSAQKRLETTRRDFVTNASHELRTPLSVLRGYLEMMQDEADTDAALQTWQAPIHAMNSQAQRMQLILDDLLKLARLESTTAQQPETLLDIPAMLERLVAGTGALRDKQLHVSLQIDASLMLLGRGGEIESVFANLISNAVRYSRNQGELVIRWWQEQGCANFSVTDSGIGIAAENIPRLTERFYRVDKARSSRTGGTGLGLAIVKHALTHHEARLEIISELDVGSTFTCHFPAERSRQQHSV